MVEQLTVCNKIIDNLENIEVKLGDEDKALLLIDTLPKTFEHFKDVLLFSKEQIITPEEVHTSIQTKDLYKVQVSKDMIVSRV